MKRCLYTLPVLGVLLFILAACVPMERDGGEVLIFGQPEGVPPVASIANAYLQLDFDTARAMFTLTERATGVVWRSGPEMTPEELEQTATITQFHAQSLFILQHETQHGTQVYYNTYRDSVRTERFEHEVLSDNKLEVRFTLGNIPRTFYVPYAIYQERLYTFTDQMTRANRNVILNAFRPYEYARLRPIDIEGGILERLPQLIPQGDEPGPVIYVLGEIPDHMRVRAQEVLFEHGYTMEDWIYDMDYFGVTRVIDNPAFNVIMQFELVGNEMVVIVPFDRITYNPTFLPIRMHLLPFFGAGRPTDEGYLFVPDGAGALLYFDTVRYGQGIFFSNIFGRDEAVIPTEIIHDNRSAYPVFGVHKNGATFAGIIDEGAASAAIRAEVPGMGGPFARAHPSFRLIHGDVMDFTGRSARAVLMHEYGLQPDERIVVRYTFGLNPGYVGMAEAYRAFLQARYPWLNNRVQAPVTAMVEILGSAVSPQHLLGFPVDRPFALTTYGQAADMLETFAAHGWQNVQVKMRGAHNRSIDHRVPNSVNLISQLGGRSGFNQLVDTAARLQYNFFLEGDFMFMRDNRLFDGFGRNRDTVRQITRTRVEHAGFSHVYFGSLGTASILADPISLATPQFTQNLIRNFTQDAAGRGVDNIAFRSMASALAGDYRDTNHITREASMHMRADLLRELSDGGTGIWLNYGFSFAMPFADVITGMPLTDQGFNVTDVSVPFYQIALHGLIPFAGRPLNLAEDYSYHWLKSVESGSSLFFSFMYVPAAEVLVSRYMRYFANEFNRWYSLANEYYHRHRNDLGHLYNQLITGHEILAPGVTVTVYEDNTRVYVNTSMGDFVSQDGVAVASRRYVVVR
ncbi:MAG: DUF5696 domain-containing protein [Defluviitaleaceae bacterium]|nr:DUF5696 domain-containing protein [Defluviitaleaceae bacterium]MCL2238733.1 DUF5696 domain-containing protein [Defluviitaleaceae bacterium]